jgi:hypothetical protein
MMSCTPALTIVVMVLFQMATVTARGEVNETLRVEPTILRMLDSIQPNTRLIFQAKRGQEIVLLGDNLNMSLYGLDASFNTNWSWTPESSKFRFAGIAAVQMNSEGIGECLVGSRSLSSSVYRYSFADGRTLDSSLLTLPKPAYHIIQNIDAAGNIVAFTARVQTLTTDSLFAYVVDTVSGWHSVWRVPVTNDIRSIGESAIRIVDTSIVVYWQEQVNGIDYRNRIMVKGIHSEVEQHSVTLSDLGDHRYQAQFIETDESDRSIVILARATNRDEPRWGIQYWRYYIDSGELKSVCEFLPKLTYMTLSDAMISGDRDVSAVGSFLDVDPTTLQIIESTSRGFICDFDSAPTMKRFLSMQDQRPSSLSSLFRNQNELLVIGQGIDQYPFIARIDEDRITSVVQDQPGDHQALQHIGWFDIMGRSLQHPEGNGVIELLQCSLGCNHARLLWRH